MQMSIAELSTKEKAGRMMFIGIGGPELDAAALELLGDIKPGGVCLFARNIRDAGQTRKLLDDIRAVLPFEPFLSLDQEGGTVDRLRRVLAPMPAAAKMRNADDASTLGNIIGEAISILGFNTDFAPVVDVIDHQRSSVSNGLHNRAFGLSADDVIRFTTAFLEELRRWNILPCLKHFPGLGAATSDSHEELPEVGIDDVELFRVDLAPYRALCSKAGRGFVMSAHAAFPFSKLQETDQRGKLIPSSLSRNFVTGLLRNELGSESIAVTDDLEMGAILRNFGIGTAAVMAVNAGEDMLAVCAGAENIREVRDAVVSAVEQGRIASRRVDDAVERIEAARHGLKPPASFDEARLKYITAEIAAFAKDLDR